MYRKLARVLCAAGVVMSMATVGAAADLLCPAGHRPPFLAYTPLKLNPPEAVPPAPAPGTYVLDEKLAGKEMKDAGAGQKEPQAVVTGVEEEMPAVRFKTETAITPYVGAGLSDPNEEKGPGTPRPVPVEEEKPAPYLGAGIGCDLGSSARLNLGYRYSSTDRPNTGTPSSAEKTPLPDDNHDFSLRFKLDF